MKPTKSNETDQQDSQQNTNQMTAPEAASKRAVEEVERKADTADEKAENAKDMAREEAQAVHADLKARIDDLEEQVLMLDRLVNKVYEIGSTRDDEPSFNAEMPHVAPDNRDPQDASKSVQEVFTDEQ
jgi:hypothetical protein